MALRLTSYPDSDLPVFQADDSSTAPFGSRRDAAHSACSNMESPDSIPATRGGDLAVELSRSRHAVGHLFGVRH
eukprot:13742347-Alexandrium_andersonii.AAC.1